ncbi:MAG: carbohydrate binding family 9 domain-containing protein, partial [Gemmatimonadetes bacterium]|nr:carbohydrate binding family 9 domain-containing protein [Gemmatimonadota bacterium]
MSRFNFGVVLLLGLAPAMVEAQPSSKVARASRVSGAAPRVDGRLDPGEWATAQVISDFLQQRPREGTEPSEKTEVWVLYDDQSLYIGARMHRANPDDISRTVTRRDGFGNAERLVVTFDPQMDRRTGVGFGVSVAGVRSDWRHTQDDEMRGRESQFDPVWNAAAASDSLGWTAEMRIPFSQLRFPPNDQQRWGFQVDRWMPDKNEDIQWVMIPPRETGYISRFGTLEGIEGVRSMRPVELVPYIAGDATRRATAVTNNPLNHPYAGRLGMDAKFAVGSNLTLDATVNPDFGQVEADPAEVNLSAFETFFDERRP